MTEKFINSPENAFQAKNLLVIPSRARPTFARRDFATFHARVARRDVRKMIRERKSRRHEQSSIFMRRLIINYELQQSRRLNS